MAINTYLSIISSNVNGLNAPIKRQSGGLDKKEEPAICCLQETHFRDFPGSPVVKALCFHYRGHRFDPWLGTKIPHTAWYGVAKKNTRDPLQGKRNTKIESEGMEKGISWKRN